MYNYLDFEKPVADLEGQILELKKLAQEQGSVEMSDEIRRLEKRSADALKDIYRKLTPGRRRRSPATRTVRTAWNISNGCSPSSRRLPGIANSPMTKPSRPVSVVSTVRPSPSSGRKRVPTPRPA